MEASQQPELRNAVLAVGTTFEANTQATEMKVPEDVYFRLIWNLASFAYIQRGLYE